MLSTFTVGHLHNTFKITLKGAGLNKEGPLNQRAEATETRS